MNRSSTSLTSDLHKLATGSAMAFSGTILGNALIYLFGVIMGRLLGAETVGLYFLALVLMQFTGSLCRVGLPDGLVRYIAIYDAEGNFSHVKGTILFSLGLATAASMIVSALLFELAGNLSIHVFRQPDFVPYVRWIAATLPFFTVLVVLLSTTQALKRMDLVILARDLVQPIIMIAGAVVLYSSFGGPASFLAAHLTSMVIACATLIYCLVRSFPRLAATSASFDNWKRLLAFSLPVAGGDVVHYLFRWSDTLLLSLFGSASDVGIYNAALRTTLLLSLLAVAINALYAPIMADHYHHGRHQRVEIILKTLIRWCLTLALPIVLVMCLLAEQILSLWGSNFTAGSTVLIILALSQLLFIPSGLLALTLLMSGKQYLEVGNVIAVTVISIGLNLLFIPRWGIVGAALAMLLSQAGILFIRLIEVRHVLELRLYTSSYLKPVLALLPASILAIVLHVLFGSGNSGPLASNLATMVTIFIVTTLGYFAFLYCLGFEEEDLTVWRQIRTT